MASRIPRGAWAFSREPRRARRPAAPDGRARRCALPYRNTDRRSPPRRCPGSRAELALLLADPTYHASVLPSTRPGLSLLILPPTAARRRPKRQPLPSAAAQDRACRTGGRRLCAATPPTICPPCGMSSAWRISRFFCDEPTTPENTAPARAVHAALDLLRGSVLPPRRCCACSRQD